MRLSSMADYAVVTMTAAARHCGRHGAGGARVSAQQLADETGLPVPTVQKLVSKLAAAGLLKSVRGLGGGLKLARPAAAISLADIVEAVEGPIAMAPCSVHGRHDCTLEADCTVRPHWPEVDAALRGALAGVTLTQLTRPVPAGVVAGASA
ncbi:AsnC family transcriptional regulator [Novosphingobium fuchskuhlense]|uniref:AsnC family transcriptional regulator n=1 Tax=Novosphingobium fuchskuhlense TaxID=1117702 RepID=A0A124JVD8_9SPHN|nr:Rrf2 family transcriptional regulator [Novosphingobium fuchskuhlense]KUR72185.1 AsnC family transcriptional regulator [Novosphingobium fuchskuhlense]